MKLIIPVAVTMLIVSGAAALGGEKADIRFLAESAPNDFGDVVWVAAGKEGGTFSLPVDRLSESHVVPKRVFGLQSKRDQRKLAVITLPEDGDSFVVLLIPEAAGTLKSMVIDTSGRSFLGGDVFLYNGTDRTVAGHLGSTKFELVPGEGKPVRPRDPSDGSYDVAFNVREEAGDRVLRTMRWPVQTRSRSYCFFFRNPARNRVEFRAVDEFVEPGKK